jgi:hypothetical protein
MDRKVILESKGAESMTSITVIASENHAGEHIAFRLDGVDYSHTFRGDHDFARGMANLRDRIATGLKSPPYSVALENVTMRLADGTAAEGMRLAFSSSWEKWPIELVNVEGTEALEVIVDAPASMVTVS